jgi:hypothetical protein
MSEEWFDDALLQAYMEGFYGFGNYAGAYWFVGMEEGGGADAAYVTRKISDWRDSGRQELQGYSTEHAGDRWFGPHARLQPTWSRLIRILLSAEGVPQDREDVRTYQRTKLGRSAGNDCLLELLPLPSPSTGGWLYGRHSRLPSLATREIYKQAWSPLRATHIQQRIAQYKPKVVVFYSISPHYLYWWKHIAGVPLTATTLDGCRMGSNGATVFAIVKHPVARGSSNAYWATVGQLIAAARGTAGAHGEE